MHRHYKTYLFYVLLSTLAAGWGCRRDVEEFRPYTPTQESLDLFLSQAPDATQHTVFNFSGAIPDTTLTTASGVRVFLADTEQLFADDSGTPIPCSSCPALKVEVTTVISKGDMVARGLPTVRFPDLKMLESAGLVRVQASCQGKPLQLLSNPDRYLKVQIPNDAPQTGMKVFAGKTDAGALLGWEATNSEAFFADWPKPNNPNLQQSGYELIVRQLGWTNCARPLTEQSSPFCVSLPEQFTALNARVFLVFQTVKAVAELDGADDSHDFCYAAAPLGYPVTVLVVGKTGGQYWLAQKFTEIGSNVQMPLTPQPLDEKELLAYLQSL